MENTEHKHHHHKNQLVDFAIDLGPATAYTTAWRERPDGSHSDIKAWKLPIVDFTTLLAVLPGDAYGLRFYIGIDDSDECKLMVVGVDGNNADILTLGDDGTTGIYDFSQPCPRTCDDTSPLSGAPL